MNRNTRQALSALGLVIVSATLLVITALVAGSLRSQQEAARSISSQLERLEAQSLTVHTQLDAKSQNNLFFGGDTITQATAALQQRIESAVLAANGQLNTVKIEVGNREDEGRIVLSTELTIAELGLQALLFDLEIGTPYVLVDAFEARVTDPNSGKSSLHVSMTVSGYWNKRT